MRYNAIKRVMSALVIVMPLLEGVSFAQRKACEELKMEIAAKLDAKGVRNYTLTIVAAGEVKETDKVVGSCDGNTNRIVYIRG